MRTRITSYEAPIGTLWLAFTERGFFASSLTEESSFVAKLARRGFRAEEKVSEPPWGLRDLLDAYFSGQPIELEAPLWFAWGTPFQKSVWEAIRAIPYGQTRSYSWIARRIGRPRAVRAVGNAVKANPLFLLVPCHRVVRADGSLGGFCYGGAVKEWLLRLEGAI